MGIKQGTYLFIAFILIVVTPMNIYAGWEGPVEVLAGTWGTEEKQFGLSEGDSGDDFPLLQAVTPANEIVITDYVNHKQMIFDINGNFIKEVKWIVAARDGATVSYSVPEYHIGTVRGYSSEGNLYTGGDDEYYLEDSKGNLIKTYSERPLELGRVKRKQISATEYKAVITYPDKEWVIAGKKVPVYYQRDISGHLYADQGSHIIRYDGEGNEIARVYMLESQFNRTPIEPGVPHPTGYISEVVVEYGEPIIAPNGDVYTWKRTPDKYSIIKWTWQEPAQ